ncbi:MAG TPA: hypothetical protein VMR34_02360 [Candidatus Saccharimonadales bacterium]|nr:hypothetical protein [Candidatus Saccharimonadales bacterium]
MSRRKRVSLSFPAWVGWLYTLLAVILVPWTILLAIELPTRHLAVHWDVAWVGLDIGIAISLLLTGYSASLKSKWVTVCASATGTLLLVDAWFDIVTSREGVQVKDAVLLAIFIELPLSAASFWLAHRAIAENL